MTLVLRGLATLSWLTLSVVLILAANPLSMIRDRIPRLNVMVERAENCPEVSDPPINLQHFLVSQVGFNKFAISGKSNFTITFEDPISVVLETYKCVSKDDDGSCEYYFKSKWDNVCALINRSQSLWKTVVKNTDLPDRCPMPPKVYTVANATLDLTSFPVFPVADASWRTRCKYYRKQKLIGCFYLSFTTEIASGAALKKRN